MSTIKNKIEDSISSILTSLIDLEAPQVIVEIPTGSVDAHYSSNVALKYSSKAGKKPMELAKEIADKLSEGTGMSAEAVEPGFINLKVSHELLSAYMDDLLNDSKEIDLTAQTKDRKKVVIEYTDPNPFKEFHIGHLYSNSVGEAISRILEAVGHEVFRVNYQGDVGLHVAKAVYGMQKLASEMPKDGDNIDKKAEFMGKSYSLGAKLYEEDDQARKEIEDLNEKIYAKDASVVDLYEKGRAWSLEYFDSIYRRLGTKFDKLYFESEAGEAGLEIVENNPKVFLKDEGAVIFKGEVYGLHTRVFINSHGLPTYEAKELGLAPLKYKDFPYDKSIIITGNEINDYFRVLLKALELINPDLASKTMHLSHGMVRLSSGKMSSRTGEVIKAEELLDDIESKLKEQFDDVDNIDQISVGAAKYALLKSGIGKDIIFDLKESVSLHGNSGPYIQYTYARTQSILVKKKPSLDDLKIDNLEKEENELLRHLIYFPDYIDLASKNYAPSTIATHLFELSSSFNNFYEKHKILESDKENLRLALTYATGKIIKKGLYLLGIEAPQRM